MTFREFWRELYKASVEGWEEGKVRAAKSPGETSCDVVFDAAAIACAAAPANPGSPLGGGI